MASRGGGRRRRDRGRSGRRRSGGGAPSEPYDLAGELRREAQRERSGARQRQAPERRRRGGGGGSDLSQRVLVAIPAAVFALFIVTRGGLVLALGLIGLGVLALHELYTMMGRAKPVNLAGFLALAGLVLAATYGDETQIVIVLVAFFPVTFLLAVLRPQRENAAWGVAATLLGVTWVGLAMAHAVLLRDLAHGDGLLIDVLVGTFIGDSVAYFGGRVYGRRKLAPVISPNKTVEGLVLGIAGGTAAFWFAGLYQDWLSGLDALAIGFAVALAAPVGDLFESMIKRDLDVKDTGRFFGAHGGVLDRLDAVFFTVVAAYYATIALGAV
jgi:phosphatidate cytidylyltransferase